MSTNSLEVALAVYGIREHLVRFIGADTVHAFLRGNSFLEEIGTSRYHTFLGCYGSAVMVRAGVGVQWYLDRVPEPIPTRIEYY